MQPKKTLSELTLLDRFLFDETMEEPENMRILLEIILGKEVVLATLPQTEKEQRFSNGVRQVRMDVWAKDSDDSIYDTEVQQKNTCNLPKRSRYYQGMIDAKLLEPGDIDFNKLNMVYIILIAPFDLFGYERYMYTFCMACKEEAGLSLEDGAVRIFLNTHGKNDDEVSPELVELLHYMENTTEAKPEDTISEKVKQLQKYVKNIKSREDMEVKYMQAWEERIMEQQEAYGNGMKTGMTKGDACRLVQMVESLVGNMNWTLEKACEASGTTLAAYTKAKEVSK